MPGNLNLKKSWHPGLMKNQQKIWEEEQNKVNELKKIKERNKEIAEESEKLELLQMQYGKDFDSMPAEQKAKMNKLGWMYDQPSKKDEAGFNEMRDEFLLGKNQVEKMLMSKNSFKVRDEGRIGKILANERKPVKGNKVELDDPMAVVRREKIRKQKQSKNGDDHKSRGIRKPKSLASHSHHSHSHHSGGHRSHRSTLKDDRHKTDDKNSKELSTH